jgi:hypothetical protein
MSVASATGVLGGSGAAVVLLGRQGVEEEGDVEEMRRLEYEWWELKQAMSGLPMEEWEPFVPSDAAAGKRKRNGRETIRNLKKPKEETGKERWERIEEEKNKKEIKRALREGKKMRKEGKMRAITSYFKK